jgi:uncharacterized lipoprotein NlpE involved in copper resistance
MAEKPVVRHPDNGGLGKLRASADETRVWLLWALNYVASEAERSGLAYEGSVVRTAEADIRANAREEP